MQLSRLLKDLKTAHDTISIKTDWHYFHRIILLLWLERLTFFVFAMTIGLSFVAILLGVEPGTVESDLASLGIKIAILGAIIIPFHCYGSPKDYTGGGCMILGIFAIIVASVKLGISGRLHFGSYAFTLDEIPVIFSGSSPALVISAALWLVANLILCGISVRYYRDTYVTANDIPWEL